MGQGRGLRTMIFTCPPAVRKYLTISSLAKTGCLTTSVVNLLNDLLLCSIKADEARHIERESRDRWR